MAKNFILLVLSILVICGYLIGAYFVLGNKVQTTEPNQLLMVGQTLGGLQAMAGIVISYFFGTTKGSEEKTSMVSDAISKLPNQPQQTTTTTTQSTK